MPYMRGPCYVWRDDHGVHVWARDGYDGWDNTGWAENQKHPQSPESGPRGEPSGVGIRQEIADAYVVMRLAELVCEQRIGAVIESAVANFSSNGGCLALQKLSALLVNELESIGSDPVQPLQSSNSGARLSAIDAAGAEIASTRSGGSAPRH
jgi:hypothetical protein